MKSIELKIKLKHLAYEAKIIRQEENRAYAAGNTELGNSLHLHRVGSLRAEARATHLAYQYLRGFDYRRVEPGSKTSPRWDRVKAMVKKYGQTEIDPTAWVKGETEEAA